jgi:hypothetical protein
MATKKYISFMDSSYSSFIGGETFPVPALTIENITREDTGEYSCHLKNAFGRGNSSTTTQLDVTCES